MNAGFACGRWGADGCCDVLAGSRPMPCNALTHLQAGGPGQAGRAGQMPDACWPPAAGTTPAALPASARAAIWGTLAMRHAHEGVPTEPDSSCAAGRGASACHTICLWKHHGWRGLPLTFMICVRWARLCRLNMQKAVASQTASGKSDSEQILQVDSSNLEASHHLPPSRL